MTKSCVFLSPLLLLVLALSLSACFQQLERVDSSTTIPVPTTRIPTSTIPPTPTETPPPTPTLTPTPTPTPNPGPTPEPPLLRIAGPQDGSTVRSNILVVHGASRPGARVTVNGDPAVVDENGEFRTGVLLSLGRNQVEVKATDTQGETATQTLTVTLQALYPLFLSVTEPLDATNTTQRSVPLSGITAPDARITVNGRPVPVTTVALPDLPNREIGIFSTTVSLELGPNVLEVVATNPAGEVITTTIAVLVRR